MAGFCPTAAELAALVDGSLPEAVLAPVAEHVDGCPACEAAVLVLERQANPLVDVLRGSGSGELPAAALDPAAAATFRLPAADATRSVRTTTPRAEMPGGELPRPTVPGYEILDELGRGGIGVVYKALRLRLQRVVALKMLRAGAAATPQELARFLVEAEMVARVTHPHIVQIHEIGQHNGIPFVVFEYVEGGTLAEHLHGQPWPADRAASLVELLARAVQHAHRCGVVHRDLKPANVLLTADGTPKIADFGLAKPTNSEVGLTSTGAVVGTPLYMAPEQARGERRIGPAADIYALGVILYELLAGRPPFAGDGALEVLRQVVDEPPPPLPRGKRGVPRDLATICVRCLEKDPARRYEGAEALAEDLRRYRQGEPIHARRVSEAEQAWLWVRRRPAIAALLATLLLSLTLGAAISGYFAVQEHQRRSEAELARDDAAGAKRSSDRLAAELTFRAALRDAETGLVDQGMFRLLDALQLAPAEASDFRRVLCANLAALGARLPAPRHVLAGQHHGHLVDGARFATVTADQRVQLWHTATAAPAGPPSVPLQIVNLRQVLNDGRRAVVTETENGELVARVRDLTTGAVLSPTLAGSHTGVSADERFFWTGRFGDPLDGRRITTQFVDLAAGTLLPAVINDDFRLLRGRDGRTVLMTFAGRGDAPPNPAEVAHFRDLLTGTDLPSVELDAAYGDAFVRFNGTAIVTADKDGTVRWWDPATGKMPRPPWRPERASRKNAGPVLTADGRTLVVFCSDSRVRWYALATGREADAAVTLPPDFKEGVYVSADGHTVLASGGDGVVRLWQVGASAGLPAHPSDTVATYAGLAVDPRGNALALTSRGHMPFTRLVHADTGAALGQPLAEGAVLPVFTDDGSLLATCTLASRRYAPAARIWDARTGLPRTPPLTSRTYIHGLAFSPDQRTLAVGAIGGTTLFDSATGQRGAVLRQSAPVGSIAYSRTGRWLATGSRHGWTNLASCWCVWETASNRPVGAPVPTTDAPLFAFAPDDTLLALELDGGRLRRWNVAGDSAPNEGFTLHAGRKISQAVFRADTARLLTGYANGTAQLWDTATGQPLGAALTHNAPVSALAFSPDGATLAVGGEDGTVVLWDAATALPLGPPLVHHFGVLSVRFSADGTVRTVTTDGAVHTWPSAPPVPDDLERLTAWVRAATGAHAAGDRVIPDDAAGWREARQNLTRLWPTAALALNSPLDLAAADQRSARQAEADGDHFAALWHLDRLLRTAPSAELYLRRAAMHASAGRRQDAEADFRHAAELAGPEPLLPELRRQASEARLRQDWRVALLYLDQLTTLLPNDWRSFADRAEVQGQLGKPVERLADSARAVQLGAEPAVVLRLVDDYAAQERWQEAVKLLAGQKRLSLRETHRLALLWLKNDNPTAYRRLCQQTLCAAPKLTSAGDPAAANSVLWLCCLAPGGADDYTELIRLAERVIAKLPPRAPERAEVLNTLGALLYRAGRDHEAKERLQEAIAVRDGHGSPADWLFLALACHRLGRPDEAQTWLTRLRNAPPAPTGFSWQALELRLLRDEVERTIGAPPPAK